MSTQLQTQTKAAQQPSFTLTGTAVLQRKCACGQHTLAGGECEECRKNREGMIQREAVNAAPVNSVPPIVHEVLSSSGQPLDAGTRAFMGPRFGYDFSQVRVHTDARAAESARAVGALAYTVGGDVVFGTGQYTPGTSKGRRLLAHELTHVVQQTMMPSTKRIVSDSTAEKEAQWNSQCITLGKPARTDTHITVGMVQRQEESNQQDDRAKRIIGKATNTKIAVATRATDVVWDIVKAYYPSELSKVLRVVYDNEKAGNGLETHRKGKGTEAKGIIRVGDKFLEISPPGNFAHHFAHHVLQVGHELLHVSQYQSGMIGGANAEKREFLAFYWEALEPVKEGTGSISFATSLSIIDHALGSFNCLMSQSLSKLKREDFTAKKEKLLRRREEVNGKAGNRPTDAPTECKPLANKRKRRE